MPTKPASVNPEPVSPVPNPLVGPVARALLDNGYSFEQVIEWMELRLARNNVRSEAWWLGEE